MDQDGVDAEVLYPTPRLAQAVVATPDVDFHLAMVRAYNDWISEYVEHAPERFGGLAMLPNRGVDAAAAEIERVWGRPGMRGVVMGCYPNGTLEVEPEDDAVLARAGRRGHPAQHPRVAAAGDAGGAPLAAARATAASSTRRTASFEMIFAGIFDRFPALERRLRRGRLRLGAVLQGADRQQLPAARSRSATSRSRRCRASTSSGTSTSRTSPTRSASATATTIGVERMLWSSDYPHISADWPYSWRTIERSMSGVPDRSAS